MRGSAFHTPKTPKHEIHSYRIVQYVARGKFSSCVFVYRFVFAERCGWLWVLPGGEGARSVKGRSGQGWYLHEDAEMWFCDLVWFSAGSWMEKWGDVECPLSFCGEGQVRYGHVMYTPFVDSKKPPRHARLRGIRSTYRSTQHLLSSLKRRGGMRRVERYGVISYRGRLKSTRSIAGRAMARNLHRIICEAILILMRVA